MRSIRNRRAEDSTRVASPYAWPCVAAVVAAAACIGCRSRLADPLGTPSDCPPQRGGRMTVASYVNVRSIDPAVAFDEGADPIQRLVFARLLHITATGKFEPELAESYWVTPDGLHLTMRLRGGARFHDGAELTAQDVKRSFERMLDPATPCSVPSFYERIVGYEAFHNGKASALDGVRAPSDDTVSFDLSEPDPTFLAVLTLPAAAPVCPSTPRVYDPSARACGAGPYKLVHWNEEGLRLDRHDGYFDRSRPYLDGIDYLLGIHPIAQRFRFEHGDLDILHDLSMADGAAFRTDPRWIPLGAWTAPRSTKGLFMNTEMPPFDRVAVRQAVSMAIDRESLQGMRGGMVVAANQMVPAGVVGHDPDFPGQRFDPQAALERMRAMGFAYDPSTGRGGYPEPIDYLVAADSFDMQIAEVFQQQLARIGIRIRLKAVSWAAYLAQTGRRKTVRMGMESWSADFDDPSDFFEPILSTKAIQEEESQNRAFFSNAELDQVLDRARRELDPVVRKGLYRRAEEIVRDQAPWAIAYGYRRYDVWQGYVRGYRPNPVAFQDVAFVWMDRDQRKHAQVRGSVNALGMVLPGEWR